MKPKKLDFKICTVFSKILGKKTLMSAATSGGDLAARAAGALRRATAARGGALTDDTGPDDPAGVFFGNVVKNITDLVGTLGSNGLTGLLSLAVILYLFKR